MMRFRRLIAGILCLLPSLAFAQQTDSPPPGIAKNGDASGATVTPPGGAATSLSAIISGLNNILTILPQASASTDYTAVLNTVLGAGKRAYLPYTGTPYRLTGGITLAAGAVLACDPGVKIQTTATSGTILTASGANSQVIGCLFDGQSVVGLRVATLSGANVLWDGLGVGGTLNAGQVFVSGSDVTVRNSKFIGAVGTAMTLSGAARPQILENEFENGVGFGILANGGSYGGLVRGNWTNGNGIELFGGTYQSSYFRLIGNRSNGTGDNCFSVSGTDYTVTGNTGTMCSGNGLGIYGSRNTATGNVFKNNAQGNNVNPGWNAGINIIPGYGGAGQYNVVYGNQMDDDQATPTQKYGLSVSLSAQYLAWTASTSVAAGAYTVNGLNIYQTTAGGTTGSTPPTHTSGTVSDGGVQWTYLNSYLNNATPDYNNYGGNTVVRYGTSPYLDTGTATHNSGFRCFNPQLGVADTTTLNSCGTISGVVLGQANVLGGGTANVVTGSASVVSGTSNFVAGSSNTVSGSYNAVTGRSQTVTGTQSMAAGYYVADRGRYSFQGFASGSFSTSPGTAQSGGQILRATATSTTAVRLTADAAAAGAANVMNLPATAVGSYGLRIYVHILDATAPANTYSWTVPTAILTKTGTANSTTTLTLGTPVTLATNSFAPTVSVTADTTNGGLNISVTPPAGNTDTIRAVARVESVEVQ